MKDDCFAYNRKNGHCTALTVCDCTNCAFYASADDALRLRKQALESLMKKDCYLYFKDKYNLKQY